MQLSATKTGQVFLTLLYKQANKDTKTEQKQNKKTQK